jgi:hypothetical protein
LRWFGKSLGAYLDELAKTIAGIGFHQTSMGDDADNATLPDADTRPSKSADVEILEDVFSNPV